ncbi:hypothetical protein HIM_07965 [Hirsutella minnesotensis 3608]|uniref:Uncharacterized protein n=1 Tax=Hirsutella minnesotensis 3608 TaxID=1043627 RepID=A0A0F7ZHG6_9HYPO|nr:hypothetical protein HIM_07965 [Hirsutella minnesotensis 3608]
MRRPIVVSSSASPATKTRRLCRLLLGVIGAASLVSATPYPKTLVGEDVFAPIFQRNCGTMCGANNQLCCGAGQVCTTLSGNVATCIVPGGSYGIYTTTWTETHTYTSTIMTHWIPAPQPTAGVDCVPQAAEQQACGPICCAGWQTCAFQGQCSVKPGYVEPSAVVVTTDGKAIGADGGTNGGGLSAGAIAGIVIGTLAGVALLLLLCFCCIARGLWAAIFGRKHKKTERVDVYEERYSRHGSRVPSAYSRKDRHSGWFGGRPASAVDRPEKKSGGGAWLAIAGAAGTILALLNLKKNKREPPRKVMSSRYSDSYYTYSDVTTSPSSSSSGRRTAYTRRTGDSRPPRSHYSRSSRRP